MKENLEYTGKIVYVKFRKKVGKISQYSIPLKGYFVVYESSPWSDSVTDIKKHCILLCPLDLYLLTGDIACT